jgi:hypothetical protein
VAAGLWTSCWERNDAVTEAEWLTCTDPQRMLEFLSSKASDRKLRLFAVACCHRIWHMLTEERSKRAVETAERFADGLATDEDLETASIAAWNVKKEGVVLQEAERESELGHAERTKTEATLWAVEAAAWTVTEEAIKAGNSSSLVLQGAVPRELEAGYLMSLLTGMTTEDQGATRWEADRLGGDEERRKAAFRWFSEKAAGARRDLEGRKDAAAEEERCRQSKLIRDCFNPFNRQGHSTAPWKGGIVVRLAQAIYDERAFDRLPVLADALEEAGCTDADLLAHCRQPGEHVRGCWVVDLLLGKK